MHSPPKHTPFNSVFRPEFEVVEERHGQMRLHPHTDQLPLLHRALDLEFKAALPGYIARVDQRGDGFHKNLLKQAAGSFCALFNAARTDGLHLHALPDANLVSRLAVVQQITEETRRGARHWFQFYAGADFFPEVRLSGRRIVFTDHVLERFTTRVPSNLGEHLCWLLMALFGSPVIALKIGPGLSLILPYFNSILAFPFEVTDTELILTTCLTIQEINTFETMLPPLVFNAHYGKSVSVPRIRHWLPTKSMIEAKAIWERKVPLPPAWLKKDVHLTWHRVAQLIRDIERNKGHGPGTKFVFLDHIPGPYAIEILPSQPEGRVDELKFYHESWPGKDWDTAFARREWYIQHFELPPDKP